MGDLPEEGPEGEPEGPAAAAGVGAVVALGEEVVRDPALEEELELVQEVGPGGSPVAAEPAIVVSKEGSEGWEVWSHAGQRVYCPIDEDDSLPG